MISVQIAFAFDFSLSDPVRLIPMQFREPDAPIVESDARYTFQLSPSALPVILSQALDIANPCSCGDGLDNGDLTYDLEIHLNILAALEIPGLSRITSALTGARRGCARQCRARG
jgi:hypothetical protein